jgi:hypothetical protein
MDPATSARATVAVAIAIAHAVVLWLFVVHRHAQRARDSGAAPSILVLIPLPARVEPVRAAAAAAAAAERREPGAAVSPRPPAPLSESTAITDWALAAESAAHRSLAASQERERQLAALAPKASPEVDLSPPPKSPPQFGWDRSVVNRIEPLEGGGTYVHLNQRCGIVLSGFIFPVCTLGKIRARGDLFEHMDDPIDLDEPAGAAP